MKATEQGGWNRNVDRECPICGKAYLAAQHAIDRGRQTTCSRRCSYKLRGREKESRVEGVCASCRKQFSRPPSHVKGKHGANFCSRKCHYAGRRLGLSKRVVTKPYKYTEGGRTRLSKTAAHLYASGKALAFPETERAVAQTLSALRIDFTHQHVVELDDGAIVVDFMFPDGLIIELDTRDRHRELRDRDTERDRRLRKLGFKVVRLWDNGRTDNAIRAVLATLLKRAKSLAAK